MAISTTLSNMQIFEALHVGRTIPHEGKGFYIKTIGKYGGLSGVYTFIHTKLLRCRVYTLRLRCCWRWFSIAMTLKLCGILVPRRRKWTLTWVLNRKTRIAECCLGLPFYLGTQPMSMIDSSTTCGVDFWLSSETLNSNHPGGTVIIASSCWPFVFATHFRLFGRGSKYGHGPSTLKKNRTSQNVRPLPPNPRKKWI